MKTALTITIIITFSINILYSQEFLKPEIVWENENFWEISVIDDSTLLAGNTGKIYLVDDKWYYFISSLDYRFPPTSTTNIIKQNAYIFDFEGNKIKENYYGLGKNPNNNIDSSISIRHFYEKDDVKYALAVLNPYSLNMPISYVWKLVKYTFDNDLNIINTVISNFQSIGYEYLEIYFDKDNKDIFYICEHTFYEDMTEDDETFPEPNEVLKIVQIEYSTMDVISETYLDLNIFPEEENSWSIRSFSINGSGNYILRLSEKTFFNDFDYLRPSIYEFDNEGVLISKQLYKIEEDIILSMRNIYISENNLIMLSGISVDFDSTQFLENRTALLSTNENGELRFYKDYKFNPDFEAFIQYTTSFDGGNTFYHFGQWRKYVQGSLTGAYINDLMYIVTDKNCNILAMYKWDTYDETERIDRTNIAGIFDYDEEHFIIHSNFYPGRGNAEEKPFALYMAKVKKHSPVSVEEDFELTNKVSLFPNPVFDNLLHIHTTALITNAELTDILGRTVFKQSGNVEQISTSGLAPGLYLLKLYTAAGEVLTEKVVVR